MSCQPPPGRGSVRLPASVRPVARRPQKPEPDAVVLTDPAAVRALAHPARLVVIDALYDGEVLTATECAERAGVTPSAMSYHLRALEKAGLVVRARRRAATGASVRGSGPGATCTSTWRARGRSPTRPASPRRSCSSSTRSTSTAAGCSSRSAPTPAPEGRGPRIALRARHGRPHARPRSRSSARRSTRCWRPSAAPTARSRPEGAASYAASFIVAQERPAPPPVDA